MPSGNPQIYEKILLGTAVGDSLGLPAEGLPPKTITRRWKNIWKQRLFLGYGFISDDTEHSVWVARSLIEAKDDATIFQKRLAYRLRWWLAGIPAGIGFATLRSIIKLWLGFSPSKSGVFSAGNGPAMRSAIIGAYYAHDSILLRDFVLSSTRLTHTDPKANTAAMAVALTAKWIIQHDNTSSILDIMELASIWKSIAPEDIVWSSIIDQIIEAIEQQENTSAFAKRLGLKNGVTGYAYHSVPVALYSWFKYYGNYRQSLIAALDCGGDTDTVGAICGALAALHSDIPQDWTNKLIDRPISVGFLRQQAISLDIAKTNNVHQNPVLQWYFIPLRNLIFLLIVLSHGFRRLIPL